MKRPLLIDLNCDLGEDESPEGLSRDLSLLDVVTSVNVACAGHDHFSILDELTHEDGAIATRALDLMRSLDNTYIS